MGENEGDHLEIPLDDVVNNQLTLFNLVACSTPPSLALLLIEHNREREEASRPRVTALSEVTRTCVAGTGKKQIDFVMINSSPQVRRETKERTPSGSLSALFFPPLDFICLVFLFVAFRFRAPPSIRNVKSNVFLLQFSGGNDPRLALRSVGDRDSASSNRVKTWQCRHSRLRYSDGKLFLNPLYLFFYCRSKEREREGKR